MFQSKITQKKGKGEIPMFLTTEPSVPEKKYTPLRVVIGEVKIHYSGSCDISQKWRAAIEQALSELEHEGIQLQADGVISIQVSSTDYYITMIGAAIKFLVLSELNPSLAERSPIGSAQPRKPTRCATRCDR